MLFSSSTASRSKSSSIGWEPDNGFRLIVAFWGSSSFLADFSGAYEGLSDKYLDRVDSLSLSIVSIKVSML